MVDAYMLSIDLAKRSFQVCATDRAGSVLYNRTMSRAKLEQLLAEQVPCIVAVGACTTSHFWGRHAQTLGHEVPYRSYFSTFVEKIQRILLEGQNGDQVVEALLALAVRRS